MPERLSKELDEMKQQELLNFIKTTVDRLHDVADYLETSLHEEVSIPDVGFDTNFASRMAAPDDTTETTR